MAEPDNDEQFITDTLADLDRLYGLDEPDPEEEEEDETTREPEPQDDTEQPSEGELPGSEETPDLTPQPAVASTVTLPNGTVVDLTELEREHAFAQFLQSHPDISRRVVEAAQSPTLEAHPEQPEQPELPEGVDLEDPAIRFLYNQWQATNRQLTELAKGQLEAQKVQATEQANIAIARTKERLGLDVEQMDKLRQATAELQIVPAFVSRNPANPVQGIEEALEFTYWSRPEFRDAHVQSRVEAELAANKTDKTRKNNLNRVSNSSGGSKPPPQRQEPQTEADRREAMVQEIAEAMGIPR